MKHTTSTFQTPNASRYLQQLCKHFGHKVPTTFTANEGRITFPFGECELTASETALTMRVTAGAFKLRKLERVITDHLARFAFRETPTLTWQRTS